MENRNHLSRSAARALSLRLRIMRFLGHVSLDGIESLVESGELHRFGRGESLPLTDERHYPCLIMLEGEIEIRQEKCEKVDTGCTCVYRLHVAEQETGCLPTVVPLTLNMDITALTGTCCLYFDREKVDRIFQHEQLPGYPEDEVFSYCRRIA